MRCFRIETFGQPLLRADQPIPTPKGSEVVVRVQACGVCHSDVHLAEGSFDLGEGRKIDLTRGVAPPRVLGHEIMGEVAALGPDAIGVKIGDRRVVYPWIGCGTCATCKSGHDELCNAPRALGVNADGGFADHVLVPDARYLFAFDPLDDAQACVLACSGLTAFGALRKVAPLPAGGKILIIGAGGVGLSAVRLCETLTGQKPIVADPDQSKWPLAMDMGAAETVDPNAPDTTRNLLRAGGVQAAIDFVGAGTSFTFGFNALAKGGKLVVVGLFGGAAPFAPAMLPLKAATVMGSYVGSLAEMSDLMTLARAGSVPPLPLTERPLDDANTVLEALRAGQIRGRVVLRP